MTSATYIKYLLDPKVKKYYKWHTVPGNHCPAYIDQCCSCRWARPQSASPPGHNQPSSCSTGRHKVHCKPPRSLSQTPHVSTLSFQAPENQSGASKMKTWRWSGQNFSMGEQLCPSSSAIPLDRNASSLSVPQSWTPNAMCVCRHRPCLKSAKNRI